MAPTLDAKKGQIGRQSQCISLLLLLYQWNLSMITDDDEGLIRIPCLCSRRSNGSNASVTCILLSVGNKSVVLGVFVQDKHCSYRSDGNGCFKTISHDWTTYWCGDTRTSRRWPVTATVSRRHGKWRGKFHQVHLLSVIFGLILHVMRKGQNFSLDLLECQSGGLAKRAWCMSSAADSLVEWSNVSSTTAETGPFADSILDGFVHAQDMYL
jgi:hypothetical protein